MCKLCLQFKGAFDEYCVTTQKETQKVLSTDGITVSYAIYNKNNGFGLKFTNSAASRIYLNFCPLCGRNLSEFCENTTNRQVSQCENEKIVHFSQKELQEYKEKVTNNIVTELVNSMTYERENYCKDKFYWRFGWRGTETTSPLDNAERIKREFLKGENNDNN